MLTRFFWAVTIYYAVINSCIAGAFAENPAAPIPPATDSATVDKSLEGRFKCKSPLSADDSSKLLQSVEDRYRQINDLTAHFIQDSYFVGSDERKSSAGEVYFKRPGMMDWLYQAPEEQRFVADGKSVWWQQKRENQVTIRDFKESFSSDVPVSFLLGVGKLRENFKFDSACNTDAGVAAKLLPLKSDSSLAEFYLLVERKERFPLGAKIIDAGGNETTIVFEGSKLNSGVEAKRFAFQIPKGSDVIDERQTASAITEIK